MVSGFSTMIEGGIAIERWPNDLWVRVHSASHRLPVQPCGYGRLGIMILRSTMQQLSWYCTCRDSSSVPCHNLQSNPEWIFKSSIVMNSLIPLLADDPTFLLAAITVRPEYQSSGKVHASKFGHQAIYPGCMSELVHLFLILARTANRSLYNASTLIMQKFRMHVLPPVSSIVLVLYFGFV